MQSYLYSLFIKNLFTQQINFWRIYWITLSFYAASETFGVRTTEPPCTETSICCDVEETVVKSLPSTIHRC